MNIHATDLHGVLAVDIRFVSDSRGSFARLYCEQELRQVTGERRIVQINQSRTARAGAIRGMHFQYAPHAEMKLVRCLKGRVWDVAVDLRTGSPDFLHWHAEELSPENGRMMIIPEGCAHGFQALEADSELLYLHTAMYNQSAEGGVRYDDPRVAISWPLPITEISPRDASRLHLAPDFDGISL